MSTEPLVCKVDDIDLEKIIFTKLQKNKKGGYSLNLKYGGHDDGYLNNIYIQTPKMFCPFGAISFGKTIKKYTINLSFENKKNNYQLDKLYNIFSNLDDIVTNKFNCNKPWLNALGINTFNFDEIRSLQNCLIKYSKYRENNPAYLNIKLNTKYNNKFLTEVFDSNKQHIILSYDNIEQILIPSIYVKSLIHIVGIWFLNGRFGVTLRSLQFVLFPYDNLQGYAFLDSSDSDTSIDKEDEENEEKYDEDMDYIEI